MNIQAKTQKITNEQNNQYMLKERKKIQPTVHIEAHKHVQVTFINMSINGQHPEKTPIPNEVSSLINSKFMTQICSLNRPSSMIMFLSTKTG